LFLPKKRIKGGRNNEEEKDEEVEEEESRYLFLVYGEAQIVDLGALLC
jgi:hypothetical protein